MQPAPGTVSFSRVVKRFARGSYQDSIRDLFASLLRPGAADARRGWFNAVDDLSFEVARGESVGLIGPNGSGKSTALKLLTGIYLPTSGTVRVEGRVAPLIEVGAGFHPDLSGRENIHLNAAITGMTRAELAAHFDRIVEFSGLAEFLDTPVKRYSSGMYMRLGFSIAAHVPSDILVVDEVLAVGDVGFRAKCLERMKALRAEGRTILFVSHHAAQVRSVCDRVVYLVNGRKEFDGDPVEGTRLYEQDLLAGRVAAPASAPGSLGAGGASIAAVRVPRSAEGEEFGVVAGHDLEVAATIRLAEPSAAAPHFSIALVRADGVAACVLHTREKGFALPTTAGDHHVLARFDALPLTPGRYTIEAALWDAEAVVPLAQATGGTIEVRLEGREPLSRPGVFEPRGSFVRG